jgi:hypothetical protein
VHTAGQHVVGRAGNLKAAEKLLGHEEQKSSRGLRASQDSSQASPAHAAGGS